MDNTEERVSAPGRRYDVSGRRAQAERSREVVVEAARKHFLTDGYVATTVAAIANDANVSVETIYKTFAGKPGLVRAIRAEALAGTGPVHAEDRSDELVATQTDARAIIRGWGQLTAEVAPLVAPIHLLVRDAAVTEPAMAVLLSELDDTRLERMTDNARRFAAAGHLRPGVAVETAGEILWTYSAPELYELLVLRLHWPLTRLVEFVTEALTAALL